MQRIDDHYTVNNASKFDVKSLSLGEIIDQQGSHYRFKYKNKNYDINLVSMEGSKYILKINGYRLEVDAVDDLDILIDKLGFNVQVDQGASIIKAPMPGLVLDVMVEVGQEVEKGASLLILEAMKMENVIKSEGNGVIKSIEISKGDKVDKGQLMIDMS
jgi:biotin carboxyl carrier protein